MDRETPVGTVVVTEGEGCRIQGFTVEVLRGGEWIPASEHVTSGESRVHICRFPPLETTAIRLRFTAWEGLLAVAEVGVYAEENEPK